MIVYKPSHGNDITPVSVDQDGDIYGQSLGGPVLNVLKKPNFPQNKVNTNLANNSTWFYPSISDYNFIKGLSIYRAIYVGADVDAQESEIIGILSSSVTNSFTSTNVDEQNLVDSSLSVSLWVEGIFNFSSSLIDNGGIVLADQEDETNQLAAATWTDEVTLTQTLKPGQYAKVWVKIDAIDDTTMTNFDDFNYIITVGDLSISVVRERGRLNFSRIYSGDLEGNSLTNDFIIKENIPSTISMDSIIKVFDKDNRINIFYFDENGIIRLLIVEPDLDVTKNKYVDVDLSNIAESCVFNKQKFTFTSFSECIDTPGSTGSSGTSGTSGTSTISTTACSTATSGTSAVSLDDSLNNKFLVDIHASNKDMNLFYIFFNEFATSSDDTYVEQFGHKHYTWNTGVIKIDVRHVNDVRFEMVSPGELFRLTLDEIDVIFELQNNHYYTSVVLTDDLFVASGFDVQDCRVTNNRHFLNYIWERDLILNKTKIQKTNMPRSDVNFIRTIDNKSEQEGYLTISDIDQVDLVDTFYEREVLNFDNDVEFVKMGSPHRSTIEHEYTSFTYDIPLDMDEFSTTWSFGIDLSAISTPTTGTTGTTGVGTTGTTGSSGMNDISDLMSENPFFLHILKEEELESYLQDPFELTFDSDVQYTSGYFGIFKMHCVGDLDTFAIETQYNFKDKNYKVITKDENGDDVETIVSFNDKRNLSFGFENVITLNVYRKQIYGCGKKYMVHFNLYINGENVLDATTFTIGTTNNYTVTYNHEKTLTGKLSYWEVRDGLSNSGENYALTMFQILSNIAWNKLETERKNENSPSGLEFFTYSRSVMLKNINWENPDDFVFPVVLQGNAYNVGDVYNTNIRRSVFDFTKINVNDLSFAFTFEGSSEKLDWYAGNYDFDNDLLVVWVRLRNWRGQRITMYYGDIRLIRDNPVNKTFEDYYGFWTMDRFIVETKTRFDESRLFNIGEVMLYLKDDNVENLIQIDKTYFYGISTLYGSNKFNLLYDDREIRRQREEEISSFIRNTSTLFKPGCMEIEKVDSIFPYKIESNGFDSEVKTI